MADKFDYWRGLPGQGEEYFIDPADSTRKHTTSRFGDEALEFLQTQTNNQAFCLSVSFSAPHARDHMPYDQQYTPDDRDLSLYKNIFLPEPLPPPTSISTSSPHPSRPPLPANAGTGGLTQLKNMSPMPKIITV